MECTHMEKSQAGPDFRKAMIHTTIVGLAEDESADERR
jgi:hypothetical protein